MFARLSPSLKASVPAGRPSHTQLLALVALLCYWPRCSAPFPLTKGTPERGVGWFEKRRQARVLSKSCWDHHQYGGHGLWCQRLLEEAWHQDMAFCN